MKTIFEYVDYADIVFKNALNSADPFLWHQALENAACPSWFLNKLAKISDDVEILIKISAHNNCDHEIFLELIDNNPDKVINLTICQNQNSDAEILKIILNLNNKTGVIDNAIAVHPNCDTEILDILLSKPRMVLFVTKHPNMNYRQADYIVNDEDIGKALFVKYFDDIANKFTKQQRIKLLLKLAKTEYCQTSVIKSKYVNDDVFHAAFKHAHLFDKNVMQGHPKCPPELKVEWMLMS